MTKVAAEEWELPCWLMCSEVNGGIARQTLKKKQRLNRERKGHSWLGINYPGSVKKEDSKS